MSTTTRQRPGIALLLASLATLVVALAAQAAPIQLRAPWDAGDWWQPSTYAGHPPSENAIDFNRVTNVRPSWPFATEVSDDGANIRAAHSGVVKQGWNPGGYGNYIKIQSDEN